MSPEEPEKDKNSPAPEPKPGPKDGAEVSGLQESLEVVPPARQDEKLDTGTMIVASVEATKKRGSFLGNTARFLRSKLSLGQTRKVVREEVPQVLDAEAMPKFPKIEDATGETIASAQNIAPVETDKAAPHKKRTRKLSLQSRKSGQKTRFWPSVPAPKARAPAGPPIPPTRMRPFSAEKTAGKKCKVELLRISDRMLARRVLRYIHAGLWIMLHNTEIEKKRRTGTVEYPEKFLASNQKGIMDFSSAHQAQHECGVCFKLTLVKKFPESDTIAALEDFAARYGKKNSTMECVHPDTFDAVAEILSHKPGNLRPRFKHPYQVRHAVACDEILDYLEKIGKNLQSTEFHALLQNLSGKYRGQGGQIKATDITPVSTYLSAGQLSKYFIDIRKQTTIAEVVENIQRIVERVEKPYYNIRVTARILIEKEDWMSRLAQAHSVGIRGIEVGGDLAVLRGSMYEGFFVRYESKIQELVTGALLVKEMSRDYAQKNQPGTRTQELEDLVRPFSELKLLLRGSGYRYPNVDGGIKAVVAITFLWMVQLILLSGLCFIHGDYIPNSLGYRHSFAAYPWPEFFPGFSPWHCFDMSGSFLAVWSIATGCLAVAAGRRRGRLLLALNYLVWLVLCTSMLPHAPAAWFLLAAWIFLATYIALFLSLLTTSAHFYPEFGPLCAPIPGSWKIAVAFAAATVALSVIYIIA